MKMVRFARSTELRIARQGYGCRERDNDLIR